VMSKIERRAQEGHFGAVVSALRQRGVGIQVGVWWPMDQCWYYGTVTQFMAADLKHRVLYEDNEHEDLMMWTQQIMHGRDKPDSEEMDEEDQDGVQEIGEDVSEHGLDSAQHSTPRTPIQPPMPHPNAQMHKTADVPQQELTSVCAASNVQDAPSESPIPAENNTAPLASKKRKKVDQIKPSAQSACSSVSAPQMTATELREKRAIMRGMWQFQSLNKLSQPASKQQPQARIVSTKVMQNLEMGALGETSCGSGLSADKDVNERIDTTNDTNSELDRGVPMETAQTHESAEENHPNIPDTLEDSPLETMV